MTREEAIDCINAIHVQMFNSGNSKWTEACDMAIADMKEMDRLAKSDPVLIEPDRPHGEWVSKPKRIQVDETDEERIFETRQEWFCSSCGKSFGLRKPEDAFCKYCGSDNRKSGDEE
jgi:hypothetical protein